MKLWLPQKRGQHGRDPKLGIWVIAVAVALLAMAFWLGSQV